MLQISNGTPFAPALFLLPDPTGVETAYLTVKATFEIGSKGPAVAREQCPVVPGDEHWGEPGKSSIRYGCEGLPTKPATDVIVVGSGHAPGGKAVPHFGVSIAVGALKKVVHVFGDRVWKGGVIGAVPSSPAPAVSVPLLWERAYGGSHDLGDGRVLSEPRNPVGRGFLGKRSQRDLVGLPVANLEHPRHPITSAGDRPPPTGVGYVGASWEPRVKYRGTYDEAWERRRAPFLPADFDPRFFQLAPADQIYPGRLVGGEPVELVNLSQQGTQRFSLPLCELEAIVHVGREERRPRFELETLLLEPDAGRFSMLWRGAVPCGKRPLRLALAELKLRRLAGAAS